MRKFVYNALQLFMDTDRRLQRGERIVTYLCDLPDCTPREGKIYFFRQHDGIVVGVCDKNNQKNVHYHGDNRDLKYLVSHQAIVFDNVYQIFNMFYRMDAVYTTSGNRLTYYVDGYGYYRDGKYSFEIVKKDGSWRAYILRMPDLNGRDASSAATHRLSDGSRKYICVQGAVGTKERMIEIAKVWAVNIQNYINTGRRF